MADRNFNLISPEGNSKVGKEVFDVLGKVIADKIALGLHDRWFRNYQLRRNQHWKGGNQSRTANGFPLVSANMLYTHIQRTTNTLTDNDPTFNVAAVGKMEQGQQDQLGDLQRCTEHWWRDQEQQDVLESSIINGEQYGIAIEKVVFNPDIEYRLGEVETIPIDPFHFGWYPVKLAAIRDIQKCEAVLHFYPISVRQLRAKYPKQAKDIKPDSELLQELKDDERREIIGEGGASKGSVMTSVSATIRELLNFVSGTAGADDDEETLLCEMWLRDKSTESSEENDGAGTITKVTKPKYPGEIRYILACSGGCVLEDKGNPNINPALSDDEAMKTYLYDKFPFSGANSIKDTSNAYGISDYEQLEALNMEVDKSLSQMVIMKDRQARTKFINPKDSGVPDEHITNAIGILKPVSAAAGQGLRFVEPPQVSLDFEKTVAIFKDFFFLISGTFELDQAQVGGRDVIAYKAIAALMERAATMMRGKIRSYSRLIRDRGRMYLSHVMNFYTEERWITYTDEDGKEASKAIVGSKLIMPAKLTVVSGSTMPISRVQQREEALALFEKQAIDQTELLDKLDWSNRSEVVKRMMAGPMGAVLQKLMTTGMPEPLMEYIKAVGETDPKDLQKALEKGQFPPFMQFAQKLIQEMQGQQSTQPDANQNAQMAEMKKLEAEVAKTVAEQNLINEKAVTERVNQTVALAGVTYDDQMIKMERAKLVNDMEAGALQHHIDGVKTGMDFAQQTHQTQTDAALEQAKLRQGTQIAAHKINQDTLVAHKKIDTAAKADKMKLDRPGRAGFNERGGRSDNKPK